MGQGGNGSGPGGHPGVVIVQLSPDPDQVKRDIETALESKHEFLFTYTSGGNFAVFASDYKH